MDQPLHSAHAQPVARHDPAKRRGALRSVNCGEDRAVPWRPAAPCLPASGAASTAASDELAPMLLGTWRLIDAALVPVIGAGGACALYERSLQLAVSAHPWLGAADGGGLSARDVAAWRAALASQDAVEATNACGALLLAADRLLAGLVGLSLAKRLLQPVWHGVRLLPPGR
jgi:hypothetical protein